MEGKVINCTFSLIQVAPACQTDMAGKVNEVLIFNKIT
jgi:hypothetical protein